MAHDHSPGELEPWEPTVEDLRALCRQLNAQGAKYIVIGGFATRAANYIRRTMAIDLLVNAEAVNEQRVFAALSTCDLRPTDERACHRPA